MKHVLIAILTILTISTAYPGDKGHGGDGVYIGSKLYSLDLVEAGIEDSVTFSSEVNARILKKVEEVLAPEVYPTTEIASKLTELYPIDNLLTESFLMVLDSFSWNLVNLSLVDVRDEGSVINEQFVQLAIRQNRSIKIDREKWYKLDKANQAALIFHELAFVMVTIQSSGQGYTQNSSVARQLVGHLMSKNLVSGGIDKLRRNLDRFNVASGVKAWTPARNHYLAAIRVTKGSRNDGNDYYAKTDFGLENHFSFPTLEKLEESEIDDWRCDRKIITNRRGKRVEVPVSYKVETVISPLPLTIFSFYTPGGKIAYGTAYDSKTGHIDQSKELTYATKADCVKNYKSDILALIPELTSGYSF